VKALLKVGYTCNNNCVFCHSSDPTRGLRPLAPSGKARRGPHSPAAPLGAGSRFALRDFDPWAAAGATPVAEGHP
jgi:hypothetical protein